MSDAEGDDPDRELGGLWSLTWGEWMRLTARGVVEGWRSWHTLLSPAWVCLLQPRTGYGRVPRSRQAEAGQPDALPGICQGFAPPSLPHWAVSHGDSDLRVNVNSQLMYPKVKTF